MFAKRSPFPSSPAITHLILAAALLGSSLVSAESRPPERNAADSISDIPRPEISPDMLPSTRWALRAAFTIAVKKIDGRRSCGELFEHLDLDGIRALVDTRYEPARGPVDLALCRRGAAVVTSHHGRRVRLCHRFEVLSPNWRAALLIHEALHGAGLNEWPQDPEALTSHEITAMVKRACEL